MKAAVLRLSAYLFTLLAIGSVLSAWCSAAVITIGFLKDEGVMNAEAEAEFNWADGKYDLTVLVPDGSSGKFEDEQGKERELSEFALIWWHDNTPSAISPAFIDAGVIDTINKYIDDGGSAFFLGSAFQYIFHLGREEAQPRIGAQGPAQDGEAAGFVPTAEAEDHPIFKGEWEQEAGEAAEKITVNSGGYPVYSDFHGSGGPISGDAIVLAKGDATTHSDTGENPLVEYKYDEGSIIIMGWRAPHWSKEDNEFRDNLEQLTANIIEYLASRSTFLAVEASGKLSVTWGYIKNCSQ